MRKFLLTLMFILFAGAVMAEPIKFDIPPIDTPNPDKAQVYEVVIILDVGCEDIDGYFNKLMTKRITIDEGNYETFLTALETTKEKFVLAVMASMEE